MSSSKGKKVGFSWEIKMDKVVKVSKEIEKYDRQLAAWKKHGDHRGWRCFSGLSRALSASIEMIMCIFVVKYIH